MMNKSNSILECLTMAVISGKIKNYYQPTYSSLYFGFSSF